MSVDSVAADVAAAAAGLAGQEVATVADTPAVVGEQTAEALHGRSPEESGEHDRGRGRDELGRYTPKTAAREKVALVDPAKAKEKPAKEGKAAEAPADPAKPDAAKASEPEQKTEPEKPKAPEAPALQAPRNWRPVAREKWSSLPREVQEEAIRLDREVRATFTRTAADRQYAESVRQVLQPYEPMLRAEGLDGPKAIGDLLKTAAALRTAPPAHKAALVANMITQFGVPIEALATALDGHGAQGQPGQPAAPQAAPVQYAADPRIDQLLAQQQQFLAQQQAAQAAAAERQRVEIEDFGATHEFFEDIREDMADELERAAKRGKPLTLEGAHARVLASHKVDPDSEIGKVLRQREEAAAAKAALAQSQRAQAAATVSVKAEPAPVVVPTGKGSVKDDVMAAYARLSQ